MMIIRLYLFVSLQLISCFSVDTKPKLTLDEFFDYTLFPLISLSPTDKHLLIHTTRPSWNISSFEHALWLYDIEKQTRKLITRNLHSSIKPKWSPNGNWIALSLNKYPSITRINDHQNEQQPEQYIYLYSVISDELLPIHLGTDIPLTLTWSNNNSVFYLATMNIWSTIEYNDLDKDEWYDVIQYRKANEFLFVPLEEKLVYSTVSRDLENMDAFELYLIDLRNTSSLVRLTNNEIFEQDLQLSIDGKQVLFISWPLGSTRKRFNDTQNRLYSVNLVNGQIERLAENFFGSIMGYTMNNDNSIYILGQLGTEAHVYTQQLSTKNLIYHNGWNGTYRSIVSSRNNNNSIAFVYSSFEKPMEVYFINNIYQLQSSQAITNFNQLFIQRDLPRAKVYSWKNEDDQQIIEGMLHYPPGQFQSKNLPLLILIHGGPSETSLNQFLANAFYWATMAASEGWLVLEPNYRGSVGYGDQFIAEVRYKPLSGPGKDILSGVDQLIKDGIADPRRLTVGGYSYGGSLTNWLITQTKRFNAAVSGAGIVDHASAWGTMDIPGFHTYFFGGFPWEVPYIYQNESPIYELTKVRTPTHIIAGEDDIRIPTSQSYMLERALYYREIPVKLIIFPNEGHIIDFNPLHGKIKIREELKWLQKYGNQSSNYNELFNNNEKLKLNYVFEIYILLLPYIIIKSI
ncbi:unnamed protein product [Rotaria sordida]|uniref:Peptidase S9 prolyl oligopeptidase catalytic domain-containing protein n=2 Tax=Rotaria sordida TaxID=392033 RepID=A0A815EC34_9BILA|nr:unnamed protein product [Rotaria sordida]